MFEINCEKCGSELIIDMIATRDEYNKDMNYLLDDKSEVIESTIQQYLIYKCLDCGEIYKYIYKDWERLMRIKTANEIMEIRKQQMFRNDINPYIIKSEAKEYCGKCSGYFGDGYCLVDIMKQCTIRKK
jgi:DNA-directed RNA polymerase subunit RPC12/RpoP